MSSILPAFATTPPALALLGVTAFLVSGATLIVAGVRMSHEAVARRVDMVRLAAPMVIVAKKDTPRALPGLPQKGLQESQQREIRRRLSMLGIPARYARSSFLATRVVAAVGLGLIMAVVIGHIPAFASFRFATLMAAAPAALAGWLLPSILIQTSARRRGNDVAAAMPEALDLLVVCVDAGLSLEDALTRVVSELGQSRPALADELALTSADLQILPSRDEALRRMADRVNLPSIRSVMTTLSQTLRYGTPLAQALRVIAAEMRNDAMIQMEERANQLPALLSVPLMLLIMPTIFLIVGGPAALRMIDVFTR